MASAAAGRVCTGFSKPYLATYTFTAGTGTGTGVSYGTPAELARGVEVSIEPEVGDDNPFYANNIEAENEPGSFTGATVTLTVDGLLIDKTALVEGLTPPGTNGDGIEFTKAATRPYFGLGYIARYLSGGNTTFVPVIIRKVRFDPVSNSAATQEEQIDYQTQELSAHASRSDRTDGSWKWEGVECETESAAVSALTTKFAATAE